MLFLFMCFVNEYVFLVSLLTLCLCNLTVCCAFEQRGEVDRPGGHEACGDDAVVSEPLQVFV